MPDTIGGGKSFSELQPFVPKLRKQDARYALRRWDDPAVQPFQVGSFVDWRNVLEGEVFGAPDKRLIERWKGLYGEGPYLVTSAYTYEYDDFSSIHYVGIESKKPLVGEDRTIFSSVWFVQKE
jgi:hypothetical protein